VHQECPDIDLYVYFVCTPVHPSRDPFSSLCLTALLSILISLSLSLSPRYLTPSIPSSDALSSQLHTGGGPLTVCRSALAPLYPDDTPAPNRRPRPQPLSHALFLSLPGCQRTMVRSMPYTG